MILDVMGVRQPVVKIAEKVVAEHATRIALLVGALVPQAVE